MFDLAFPRTSFHTGCQVAYTKTHMNRFLNES